MSSNERCKLAFEEWAEGLGLCLDELIMSTSGVPEHPYEDNDTNQFWRAWLASWKASNAVETKSPLAEQFHDMLHRDQTGLSTGLGRVLTTVGGFRWATESRGCYEWDDDRFHGEMKNMLDAIQKAAQDALDAWKRGPLPCCVLERSQVKASAVRDSIAPNKQCPECKQFFWLDKFEGHICRPEKTKCDCAEKSAKAAMMDQPEHFSCAKCAPDPR